MTDYKELSNIFQSYLDHLDGTCDAPDLSSLGAEDRVEVEHHFAVLRSSFRALADQPDLIDDPVFHALGFDREGEDIEVSGPKIRLARERLDLDFDEVIRRARNAGAHLAVQDLFRLERTSSSPLPQADATALVAALRSSLAELETVAGQLSVLRRFLQSTEFDDTVRRWCQAHAADFAATARRAQSELLAANFRGKEHADFGDLLVLLDALLDRFADDHPPL